MIKLILAYLLLVSIYSCSEELQTESHASSFNLEEDAYDFSNKLDEDDTLTLIVDGSVCAWSQIDSLIFIKKNDKITLSTSVHIWVGEKEIHDLGTVDYSVAADSLNFESLFQFVSNKGVVDRKSNTSVLTLIYKHDTLKFFSDHLADHMDNLSYFGEIQRRLYPNAEPYKPIPAPESRVKDFR